MAETDITLSVGFNAKDVKSKAQQLQKEVSDTLNKTDMRRADDKMKKTLVKMSELSDKSTELQRKLQAMENAFPQEVSEGFKTATAEVERLNTMIETNTQLTDEQKEVLKQSAEEWQEVADIHQAYLDALENHTAAEVLHATNEEYQKVESSLNNVSNKMILVLSDSNKLASAVRNVGTQSRNVFQAMGIYLTQVGSRIQRTSRDMLRMGLNLAESGQTGKAAMKGLQATITGLSGRIIKCIGQISEAVGDALSVVLPVIYKVLQVLQKVLNVLTNIVKTVAGKLKSAITGIAGYIKSQIDGTAKSTSAFGLTARKLFTTLLGFASLRAVFNKLRSAIVSAIQDLAQFNSGNNDVNAAITTLQASLTQLRNSLASAFAPILTSIAPALNQLIHLCTSAANAIAMLVASLTGKSTFLKAKKVQNDYAKSLDATGKAAGAAADKLAKFDDLDVLGEKNSGGGGGAGGGAGGLADMFEEVPVDKWSKDWAQWFKDMWDKADFSELGRWLGEKLRDALNKASDWLVEVGQVWAAKLGKSLATFLAGFLSTEGLPEAIGRFFGELYNTWQDFQTAFLENFPFETLGQFISQGLMTMIETIDWEQAGYNLGLKVNGLFDMMKGFAEKWDPATFAFAIRDYVKKAIDTIDWKANAESFSAFAVDLLQTLRLTLKHLPWKDLGTDIATFVKNLDWYNIAYEASGAIYELINGLFDFAIGFMDEMQKDGSWEKIAQEITDGITSWDWDALGDKFWQLFGEALIAAWGIIKGIISELWEAKKGEIKETVGEKASDLGYWIVEGLKEGIKTAYFALNPAAKPAAWLAEKIIGGLKSAFRIGSPSKEMEEQGEYIGQGLFNGIETIVNTISNIWTSMRDNAVKFFTDMKTKVVNLVTTLGTTLSTLWTNIKTTINTTITNIKETAIRLFTNVKDTVTNLMNTLKDKLVSLWTTVKTKLTDIITNIHDTMKRIWNNIKTFTINLITDIKTKVITLFTNMKDTVITVFNTMRDKVTQAFNTLKDNLKGIINGILGFVERLANGVVSGINRVIDTINGLGVDIPDWVPGIGGHSWHPNLSHIGEISISRLANGAVIPPNKEFLALLGDQKHGTNIEAPLDTIKEAFADVVANMQVQNTGYSEMKLDGQTFARLITPYVISELNRQGYNVKVLGV